jgi:hypothetical protein
LISGLFKEELKMHRCLASGESCTMDRNVCEWGRGIF